MSACYKQWKEGKEKRESERVLASMSAGEKARADRKRQRDSAATAEEHVEQPVLVQTAQPYAASAVAMPVSGASSVWKPVNIRAILGQRWREPTAMPAWERRNCEKFFENGPEFIVQGCFSDQPDEDSVGVADGQWVSLTDIASIFGADAAMTKVREWLASVEKEAAAHCAEVEEAAQKFGPQPGLPADAVQTGEQALFPGEKSQHSVTVASAVDDADTQYSDDDDTETPLGGVSWRRSASQPASEVY
jgi:hypothetical protein